MSILDIKKQIKKYILFSLLCLAFGIIYELFSHNVYSPFMYLAFLIPVFGLIITLILYFFKIKINKYSNKFFNYSIITLTIGSIVKGVLDIYGTSNKLIYVYLLLSLLFIFISLMINIYKK